MVKQIKLTNSEKFSCEYIVNDRLISKSLDSKEHIFSVKELPCKVKINMNPYKVKPIVRIDDVMVNYGLAKITPWDHMLEFDLDSNFFDHYFTNIIEAKRQYLSRTGQNVPDNMESYVGVDNAHPEIVDKIKELIK
jgi:hypothetical protein|tara:strand:- start:357 stop:764 length:408 start_codon:yes stop_codon:yes gene_type:complete